jgi:phage terminase large subunit-like protein
MRTNERREVAIMLPRLHSGQQRVINEAARFNVVCCGRRWGKTTLGIDRLIQPALQGAPTAFLSPTHKMLAEVWRQVRRALHPLTRRISTEQHRIELLGGGLVEMWSLESADTLRGRTYRRVVIDEAAMLAGLREVWQMVLRPTLADYAGDAWFCSTPRGRNFFWECFQRGQAAGQATWKSWQMPTRSNPFIRRAEIEAARQELPEQVFRQEFEAAFLEQGGAVFRRVRESATAAAQQAALAGHRYVVGCDWGRQNDFTCLAVLDISERALVALERFNRVDYAVQLGRLQGVAERFAPDVIVAEQNSIGLPLIEELQRMDLPVVPFVTSNASKMRIIDELALALERGTLRLLDEPVLLDELQAFAMERLPSGLVRYSAPAGQHDDTVMALALAWSAAGSEHNLVLW